MLETCKRPSLQILAANTAITWITGLVAPQEWASIIVGSCWILFGIYVGYRLIRTGQLWVAAIPMFFVIAISVGVALPRDTFDSLLRPLDHWLTTWNSPLPAGKLGHIFCFAMLTLFALAIRRRLSVGASELVLFLLLLAVATEGFQLFIAQRTTTVLDLVWDFTGAAIGYAIFSVYKRFDGRAAVKQPRPSSK